MSWLSLGTKILTPVLRAGAKATSTLFKGSSEILRGGAAIAGKAASNPKAAAVAGIGGWAAIRSARSGNSIGTETGQAVRQMGEEAKGFAHDAVNGFTGENTVEKVTDTAESIAGKAADTLSGIKDTVTESKGLLGQLGDALGGISRFLGNMFGGGGMNMFGNFFDNVTEGKVGGLGIGALLLGAYMMFGRTGILGKVGGALLAMMMIGNNSQRQQPAQTRDVGGQQQSEEQNRGIHR